MCDETAYGEVLDSLDEGLALVDPGTGHIVEVNRAFLGITGADRGALVGRELAAVTNNESRAAVAYAVAMVERAADGEPQSFEWHDRDASGDALDLRVRFSPATVAGTEYVLAVVSDVSAERALRRRKERLEEFAGVVSHDLRGPLNVIRGELDRFHETGSVEHLEAVENASDHLDSVVTDLLDLAREGQTIRETEPTSLELAARRAWSLVEARGATLSVTTDLEVEADPDRLTRALENLFRNAVEHGSTSHVAAGDGMTADGAGGPPTIEVGELHEARGFFVADDGPGIPSAVRNRVFEPGFTTSEDGNGLGLSIVRRICEAHGWSIRVDEGDSAGTRFVVRGLIPSRRADQ